MSEIELTPPRPQFWLLTQDACPKCELFKRMLAGPLKQFQDDVQVVHRTEHADMFTTFVQNLNISTTPALIRDGGGDYDVMTKLDSVLEVRLFLTAQTA